MEFEIEITPARSYMSPSGSSSSMWKIRVESEKDDVRVGVEKDNLRASEVRFELGNAIFKICEVLYPHNITEEHSST